MLASVLIGSTALMAVSLSSALVLFAHLTGRVRRSTVLVAATIALLTGMGLVADGALPGLVPGFGIGFGLGRIAVPIGVFLMLAAGINGFLVLQSPKSARAER